MSHNHRSKNQHGSWYQASLQAHYTTHQSFHGQYCWYARLKLLSFILNPFFFQEYSSNAILIEFQQVFSSYEENGNEDGLFCVTNALQGGYLTCELMKQGTKQSKVRVFICCNEWHNTYADFQFVSIHMECVETTPFAN